MTHNLTTIDTVVLVEDDLALTLYLKYKIKERNLNFVSFNLGYKSLSYINENANHIILIIDYELPDITGIDLIKTIQENHPKIPFIAITGAGNEQIASEFIKLGAYDYIIKDAEFFKVFDYSFDRIIQNVSLKEKIEIQHKIIAEKEQKYRLIFNNVRDVFLILDERMKILEISPSVNDLLGIPAEMLVNQPIFYLLPSKNQWKEAYKKLSNEGILTNYEIELHNKGKKILRTCLAYAKLTKFENKIVAIVTFRDITELKKLQRQILEISAEVEEKERKKLSEDLHDRVGPILSITKMYLNRAIEQKNNEEKEKILKEASKMIDEAIQNIRNISNNLMSNVLTEFGLEKSIKRFISQYFVFKEVSIQANFNLLQERFNPVVENIVYRCILELIHNSIKHSGCSEILLNIYSNTNLLTINYTDNGKGFDFDDDLFLQKTKGQGLITLVYRIKTIGGKIYFKRLKKGVNFTIEIPVNENIFN